MKKIDAEAELLNTRVSLGCIVGGRLRDISRFNSKIEELAEATGCKLIFRTRSASKLFIKEGRP